MVARCAALLSLAAAWAAGAEAAFAFPSQCTSTQPLSGTGGTIKYPPSGSYGSNLHACWFVGCPAGKLTLTVTRLDTESGYDFVLASPVASGAVEAEVLRVSGTSTPSPLSVEGKDGALVVFTSDRFVSGGGFDLTWACEGAVGVTPTPPAPVVYPAACTAEKTPLSGESGTLDYPSGSGSYANSQSPCWFVECASYLQLQWTAFNTEANYDFVTVQEVTGGQAGTRLLRTSGTTAPQPILVQGKQGVLVQFTSDSAETRTGFTMKWTCSATAPAGDYLQAIPTRDRFEALASRSSVPGALGVLEVKYLILGIDTDSPQLYFMNTNLWQYHFNFARDVLQAYTNLGRFNDETYFFDARKNLAGTIIAHDSFVSQTGAQGLYTVEFWPTDPVAAALTRKAYLLIQAQFAAAAGRLAHFPASDSQLNIYKADKAAFEAANVAVVLSEELFASVTFSPLNLGQGYGTLRVIETGSETFSVRDVVIFKAIPNDLSHVGGIITDAPQTPLSHINLKAKQNNMPNAYIKDASSNPTITALVGKVVQYTVSVDGYTLREATQAEADAWLESVRPATPQTPLSDLSVTEPARLTGLRTADWVRYGAKAANVAELARVLPRSQVPDGYAIPFSVYNDYMNVKRCEGVDVDPTTMLPTPNGEFRRLCTAGEEASGKSFNEQIQALMADATFQSDVSVRDARLKAFRKEVKKGEVPAAISAKLNAMRPFWPATTSIRLRSSTNNEDLAGFNGAGLYESTTHDPDEGEIAESAKKVWAGLWTFRAFEERDFYRIDHFKTYMGVLVHTSYGDEQANGVGVTKNIYQQGTKGHYVNVQYGEISVTNPEPIVVGGQTVNSVPDEFLLAEVIGSDANGDLEYMWIKQYMRHSNVETVYGKPVPTANVLTDAEITELRVAMSAIQDHFKPIYNGGDAFAMDIEFKITYTADGSRGHLEIKQARPWID